MEPVPVTVSCISEIENLACVNLLEAAFSALKTQQVRASKIQQIPRW